MRAIAVSASRAEPCPVEVPKPDPGAGEVRVKVEYAALNPLDRQTAEEVPLGMELPLEKAPQALAQNRTGGARGKTVFVI